MAVQIFKDGESKYVEPRSLKNHLDQGWSVDDPARPNSVDIQYPNTEGLSQEEAEKKVLEEMGIEVVHPEPEKNDRVPDGWENITGSWDDKSAAKPKKKKKKAKKKRRKA